jgi:dipeptidyl aminopeptidase/acylaminoacyl peptidase
MSLHRFAAAMAIAVSSATAWVPLQAHADDAIPIRDFIHHPEYSAAKISPDGRFLALTMQQESQKVLAVLTLKDMKVIRITRLTDRESVGDFYWVGPERLVYDSVRNYGSLAAPFGTGSWYAMDADGGHPQILISYEQGGAFSKSRMVHYGESFGMLDPNPRDGHSALMEMFDGSSDGRNEVVAVDTSTGRRKTLARAPRENCDMVLDANRQPRYANCSDDKDEDGNYQQHSELYRRGDDGNWTLLGKRDDSRQVAVMGTAPDGRIYALATDSGKPAAFGLLDPATDSFQSLHADPAASPSDFVVASDGKTVLAVVTAAGGPHVEIVDAKHPDAALYASLAKAFPGELVDLSSATLDGKQVVVSVRNDTDPGQLYLFDRDAGSVRFLMKSAPQLDPARMAQVVPFSFKARDGLTLYGYMTMPRGGGKGLPTIINPHGGPIGIRDDWGFNNEAQLLASRGYLVVQLNYRGSGGYGQAFEDRGHGEWGAKMQDDLTDVTRWVAAQGYADPSRTCIYGGSYGGYASLMAVAKEPGLYKCAVGYAGIYDLEMMYHEGDISERESGKRYLRRTIGTDETQLRARSPALLADRIEVPVFLAAGLKDERAPPKQTMAMRDALKAAGHPAEEVILEPNEMHGFYAEDAQFNLYAKMLAFFDKHIGPGSGAAPAGH